MHKVSPAVNLEMLAHTPNIFQYFGCTKEKLIVSHIVVPRCQMAAAFVFFKLSH